MYILGPTFLTEKILTQEDGNRLILCVLKLPDISTTVEDTVVQLTEPQLGYITTHFYQLKRGTWIDVTDACGPVDRHCATSSLYAEYEQTNDGYYTGYKKFWLDHAPSEVAGAGKLLYEVVVEKQGYDYPTNPLDGKAVIRLLPTEDYTEKNPYRYYDMDTVMCPGITHASCYTLFSVYESGWYSYVNGPRHEHAISE